MLAVLGNHDFESGQEEEVAKILAEAGVQMLDGDSVEVQGVGFAGVKGFAGGFGRRTLEPWGEPATKAFVHEAVSEALKLERALARLRTPQRVALLHYAPIEATVEGEPREIFPFLGLEPPRGAAQPLPGRRSPSTATPIAARPRAAPAAASPCSTWPCRCCGARSPTRCPSASSRSRP